MPSFILAFERVAVLSVNNFMILLDFYFCSTFVSYNDQLNIYRNDTCIGSCVVPVLCKMFLSAIDIDMAQAFDDRKVVEVLDILTNF